MHRYIHLLMLLLCFCLILSACAKPARKEKSQTEETVSEEPSEISEEESTASESMTEEESSTEESQTSAHEESSADSEPLESEESSEESLEESIEEPEVCFYDLSAVPGLRFDELLQQIATPEDADESTPGYTYIGTYEELLQESESLVDQLPEEAKACYFPMEGYLISMNSTLTRYDLPGLKQMLDQSLTRIQELMDEAGTDLTLHELLTRASIVQLEGSMGERGDMTKAHPEVMAHIASVIDNRIRTGMPLQMDATRWYAEDLNAMYGADPSYEDQYNTYLSATLPLGPIGSPTEEAILAVLYPETTDDYYFVWSEDGDFYFAETYEQHLENCEKAGLW